MRKGALTIVFDFTKTVSPDHFSFEHMRDVIIEAIREFPADDGDTAEEWLGAMITLDGITKL